MEKLLQYTFQELPTHLNTLNMNNIFGSNNNFTTSTSARLLSLDDVATITTTTDDSNANYTQCVYPGTTKIYLDCCTDSSLSVCTIISVMFFITFVAYIGIFGYIVNKNPWIKRHGLYINTFFFQMNVLLCKLR